jgi:hypothetical protein
LQFRERGGVKLPQDSPLFRQQFDRNDSLDVTHPKPLLRDGVITALDDALLRSGLKIAAHLTEDNCFPGKDRKEVGMTKGFRKFAITQMAKSRMDAEIREKLVGHTIGIATHYIRYSPEEMLQEYIKAVDLLTINEENRLKLKVDELQSKQSEIELMKIEMKKQADMIQMLSNDANDAYSQDRIIADAKKEIAELRTTLTGINDYVESLRKQVDDAILKEEKKK